MSYFLLTWSDQARIGSIKPIVTETIPICPLNQEPFKRESLKGEQMSRQSFKMRIKISRVIKQQNLKTSSPPQSPDWTWWTKIWKRSASPDKLFGKKWIFTRRYEDEYKLKIKPTRNQTHLHRRTVPCWCTCGWRRSLSNAVLKTIRSIRIWTCACLWQKVATWFESWNIWKFK